MGTRNIEKDQNLSHEYHRAGGLEQVLDDADAMGLRLFESRKSAPHNWILLKRVAEALGEPYKRLKALSAQRQDKGKTPLEEPVHTFLYEVFQKEHKRGRTVVGDTSATGLGGGKNILDLVASVRG